MKRSRLIVIVLLAILFMVNLFIRVYHDKEEMDIPIIITGAFLWLQIALYVDKKPHHSDEHDFLKDILDDKRDKNSS